MDRVSQALRPSGANAGTQRWRHLAFLHWEVEPAPLQALLPPGLTLDLFEERAFVGVVPFAMEGVRPRWSPLAFDFLETNVRTYVHRDGRDPAVFFFSLDAASWLAVRAARLGWGLPYHHAEMSMAAAGAKVDYATRRYHGQAHLDVQWKIGAALGPSAPGTIEHFLMERYLLFSAKGGELLVGQVHHPAYPAHEAELGRCQQTLLAAAGIAASGAPDLVHYAPGVDVEVFALRPVSQPGV